MLMRRWVFERRAGWRRSPVSSPVSRCCRPGSVSSAKPVGEGRQGKAQDGTRVIEVDDIDAMTERQI